jgi:hypothetical protein
MAKTPEEDEPSPAADHGNESPSRPPVRVGPPPVSFPPGLESFQGAYNEVVCRSEGQARGSAGLSETARIARESLREVLRELDLGASLPEDHDDSSVALPGGYVLSVDVDAGPGWASVSYYLSKQGGRRVRFTPQNRRSLGYALAELAREAQGKDGGEP